MAGLDLACTVLGDVLKGPSESDIRSFGFAGIGGGGLLNVLGGWLGYSFMYEIDVGPRDASEEGVGAAFSATFGGGVLV